MRVESSSTRVPRLADRASCRMRGAKRGQDEVVAGPHKRRMLELWLSTAYSLIPK